MGRGTGITQLLSGAITDPPRPPPLSHQGGGGAADDNNLAAVMRQIDHSLADVTAGRGAAQVASRAVDQYLEGAKPRETRWDRRAAATAGASQRAADVTAVDPVPGSPGAMDYWRRGMAATVMMGEWSSAASYLTAVRDYMNGAGGLGAGGAGGVGGGRQQGGGAMTTPGKSRGRGTVRWADEEEEGGGRGGLEAGNRRKTKEDARAEREVEGKEQVKLKAGEVPWFSRGAGAFGADPPPPPPQVLSDPPSDPFHSLSALVRLVQTVDEAARARLMEIAMREEEEKEEAVRVIGRGRGEEERDSTAFDRLPPPGTTLLTKWGKATVVGLLRNDHRVGTASMGRARAQAATVVVRFGFGGGAVGYLDGGGLVG